MFTTRKSSDYNARFVFDRIVLKTGCRGFCLNGRKRLSRKHSYRNAMIIGGTGTGKSANVLIPSLLTMQGSFVVHDPSGELYQKTAGHLMLKGYTLHILNFSNPNYSDRYNPLSRIDSVSEVNKIAALLIRTALGSEKADPFWNNQAISLLGLLIQLTKHQEKQYGHLGTVKRMLETLGSNAGTIEKLIKQTKLEALLSELQSFLAFDQKVRAGVISTCLSALQLWKDPQVQVVTASDSINFQELRQKPTAIFIQNPTADQHYYTAISSLFVEQLIAAMLSRLPGKGELDIFCLIDEAASLYLPSLAIAVANVRKYRCGILISLQDFHQLIHIYGKHQAETIRSNCFARLYFTGQSLQTAIELERMLGDTEGKRSILPLITRDKIRTLSGKKGLLIAGNHQPMLTKLRPYYRSRRLRKRTELPYVTPFHHTKVDAVSVLPQLLTSRPAYGQAA